MTDRPFRFAVQGGPFTDAAELAEHARHVESLGYDEIYTADHVGMVDPFAPLVVAATATERLGIGPLVVNNELHHPVLLARTAATVDALSGGRFVLGMGAGYAAAEHDAIGSPIRPPHQRVERFRECLAVLRSLLDTGAAELDGRHVQVSVDDLGVRPANPHVPILIGGHGPRMVRLAAEHADIYQFTGLVHGEGGAISADGFPVEHLDERARWLTEAAGDRNAEIERSALVQALSVDGSGPTADEVAERLGGRDVIDATPFVLIGTVDEIVDKLLHLRNRLGITHYVVRDPDAFAPVITTLRTEGA